MAGRTALLICGSAEEAQKIRSEAGFERRTVAAYVLNILMRAITLEEPFAAQLNPFQRLNRVLARAPMRAPGRRTAILVRCSVAEASRIRAAASRRDMTVSGFVLHSLKRNWNINLGTHTSIGLLAGLTRI